MNKEKTNRDYDDIINLPRHISSKHRPMPVSARAAQFAPFAALTGHNDAIIETARLTTEMTELSEDARAELDMKLQILLNAADAAPEATVTYFRQDEFKYGGSYLTQTGTFRGIDSIRGVMKMSGGAEIPLGCIVDMECRLFDGILD